MTIVFNTLNGAVTEYTGFGFQSITPTHAGSATGLFSLGGGTDMGAPIVASIVTGKKQWGRSLKHYLGLIFFSLRGSGTSAATVVGESASYTYPFPVLSSGESRAKPGRGIRENYLAFGYSNTDGADFQLDRIEVDDGKSNNRRT